MLVVRLFLLCVLGLYASIETSKLLHLSFHRGCLNNFQAVAERLDVAVEDMFIPDLPIDRFDGKTFGNERYNIDQKRADTIWQLHKDFFNSFDGIVISDTTPLARIFLREEFTKPLIIWVCNRFDYFHTPKRPTLGHKAYYSSLQEAVRKPNVRIAAYTQFELTYARSKGVNLGNTVIKPLPYVAIDKRMLVSAIPLSPTQKSTHYFIPYYPNDKLPVMLQHYQELQIPYYQGVYNGPFDLFHFKGIIHLPYAWSNIALFENLYLGMIYFIPSARFLRHEIFNAHYNFQNPEFFFNKGLFAQSEWYAPEHQELFVYFDSWQDLQKKIHTVNKEKIRDHIAEYCHQQTETVLQQWALLFKSLELI